MATAIWPLENGQKNDQQKAPRSFSHFFACFRSFSIVVAPFFALFSHFWDVPKGPNLEKIQDRLKFSISLEIFNPDLQNSPQKIGVWWVARLKISSSLEIFQDLGP